MCARRHLKLRLQSELHRCKKQSPSGSQKVFSSSSWPGKNLAKSKATEALGVHGLIGLNCTGPCDFFYVRKRLSRRRDSLGPSITDWEIKKDYSNRPGPFYKRMQSTKVFHPTRGQEEQKVEKERLEVKRIKIWRARKKRKICFPPT